VDEVVVIAAQMPPVRLKQQEHVFVFEKPLGCPGSEPGREVEEGLDRPVASTGGQVYVIYGYAVMDLLAIPRRAWAGDLGKDIDAVAALAKCQYGLFVAGVAHDLGTIRADEVKYTKSAF
jgi:hypothetical protein